MQPNKSAIKEHIEFLFKEVGDYKDAVIELAYTPHNSGAVNRAEYFHVDELDKAIEKAYELNSREGVNVYVGAALRQDNCPIGRSSLDDFYACRFIWCDLDEEGAAVDAKKLYADLPPSKIIVTGRHPYVRAQAWWMLNYYEDTPEEIKDNLSYICAALNGDPAVVDPARVMRLGGTIAWPKKEGRIPELTEVITPDKATGYIHINKFKSYFKITEKQKEKVKSTGVSGAKNIITGQFDIEKLLEATRQEGHWHFNMRDAVAAMVGKGWSNQAIHIATRPYLRDDSLKQDMITPLINTARVKFDHPEPEVTQSVDMKTGQVVEHSGEVITATHINDIDLDNIPPREFIFGEFAARKFVSLMVAPPGVGKSIFSIQRALKAAMGESWGDWECKKPLNVWLYNNEEGDDELKRRAKGCLVNMGITARDIKGNLYIDSGENRYINIARHENGNVIATPDVDQIIQEIKDKNIDYLIVDPFAETHSVNENSNDEIKQVANLYRRIALETNCAVELIHHTRKGVSGNNDENSGNADTGRGGGAVVGVVRIGFTMSTMDKKEAVKLNVPESERRWFVRLDDAKANIKPPAEKTEWLKFKSVDIMNNTVLLKSDSIGVLERINEDYFTEEYGNAKKDEAIELLYAIAYQMISANIDNLNVSNLSRILISNGYEKHKERSLHNRIKASVIDYGSTEKIISEGYTCKLFYQEGKSRTDGNKILIERIKISDF